MSIYKVLYSKNEAPLISDRHNSIVRPKHKGYAYPHPTKTSLTNHLFLPLCHLEKD